MSFRIPRRDTELRFVTKFENRPLRSCRKVAWFTKQKKLDSSQSPFWPKWADRAQNSLNVVTMVGEGHEGTVVSVHYAAVQQVTGWLFSVRLQASRSSSTAEEGRTGHQPDEELQTCIESVFPL